MFGGVQIHEAYEGKTRIKSARCMLWYWRLDITLVEAVGPNGEVTGLDFSKNMLKIGEEKLKHFSNVNLSPWKCHGTSLSR